MFNTICNYYWKIFYCASGGVGRPVGIELSGDNLPFSLATAITQKSFEIFTIKQEKHDAVKLLAQVS